MGATKVGNGRFHGDSPTFFILRLWDGVFICHTKVINTLEKCSITQYFNTIHLPKFSKNLTINLYQINANI